MLIYVNLFTLKTLSPTLFSNLRLDDDVLVLPAHGAGSPCGKAMSDNLYSTVGEEKRTNPALQFADEQTFAAWLLGQGASAEAPQYFLSCVEANIAGMDDLADALASAGLLERMEAGLTEALGGETESGAG